VCGGSLVPLEVCYDDIKRFDLDKYVEFADGYKKSIMVKGDWKSYFHRCGGYAASERARNANYKFIEIDLDRTKFKDKSHYFEDDVIRIIPEEEVTRRNVLAAASANPTVLAVAREAMDKVSRGELSELEYKIVDNSGNLHHHFI
jgi:hypothetical protein